MADFVATSNIPSRPSACHSSSKLTAWAVATALSCAAWFHNRAVDIPGLFVLASRTPSPGARGRQSLSAYPLITIP
jgi:hypothetical protein